MLNTKLKYVLFFLGLIMSPQATPAAEMGYLLGLGLEHPTVRKSVSDYVSARGGELCKLAIGAGHIADPMALHQAYRPDGSNCLTESIQGSGDYAFHRHEGWYTFSAETDAAFGSGMIGNIRTASHQDAVLLLNTWDLIWDESYHPAVLSAEHLFEKALASLKPGGIFVFTLPIQQQAGAWTTGHACDDKEITGAFNEKLAYAPLSEKFDSLENIQAYVRTNLTKIGFSSVELHESALIKALKQITGGIDFESVKESDLGKFREIARSIAADSAQNPLLAIDPIFAHTGGTYYVVAKK